jgi:hypothetical protein
MKSVGALPCLLSVILRASSVEASHGIAGPTHDHAMIRFYSELSTRASAKEIQHCKKYPSGTFIPWHKVAQDWVVGGGRKKDCEAALIVASGETSCTKKGCASVESGIWQVTSPDMPAPSGCKDGDTNPCCSVDFVRNHLQTKNMSKTKTTSFQISCLGDFGRGNGWAGDPKNPKRTKAPSVPMKISSVVGDVVPGDHSGGGLGGTQSNWIGPFCHQGGLSCETNDPYCHSKPQKGVSGDNWGGGSLWHGQRNGNQIYPFPYYYYAKFVESQGDGSGMTHGMHCHTMPGHKAVGSCGGIPKKNIPDCAQPIPGKAPHPAHQACLDSITDLAVKLAKGICTAAYTDDTAIETLV